MGTSGTTLTDADISGAEVRDAYITSEQALSANRWFLARWSPTLLDRLGLPPDHNERLESKNLRGELPSSVVVDCWRLTGYAEVIPADKKQTARGNFPYLSAHGPSAHPRG